MKMGTYTCTHTPGVAAVRAGPGRPTGIAVATFSAGWGREGREGGGGRGREALSIKHTRMVHLVCKLS